MDEKNVKQEEEVLIKKKNIEKENIEKYKVLYEHCKSISEQETARGNVLEDKAGKLFIFYNVILAFLFVVGKEMLETKVLERILGIEILLFIILIFVLFFVSKGMFFLIKVFTMQSIKIAGLYKESIEFFEKPENDLLKMYKFNSESFFEIYEKACENNDEKAENIEKSYDYLKKSYIVILGFVIVKLIEYVCGCLFNGVIFIYSC